MSRFTDPWDYPRERDEWLREQREREKREMLEILRNQFRQSPEFRGIRPRPEPAPIVRGDYLVYYLGGPLNCTQEYFWDKQMPKDRDWRDIAEPLPVPDRIPDSTVTSHATTRVNRYMVITVPKNETPFSTVQVYLAIYQEPPL